jgi:hypothetical protein
MASRVVATPLVEAQLSMGQKGEWEDAGGFSTHAKGGDAGLQRLKCWAGRMRIVDGCAGFVSKPRGSSGGASTDYGW